LWRSKAVQYNGSLEASKQGYSKGSLGRSTAVQYNGSLEASKQSYSEGSLGPSITVQYNCSVEASKQGYIVRGVRGALLRSNIMAQWRPLSNAIIRGAWGPL
jgi:hypothetical protein